MNNSKPISNPLGHKIRKIRELKGFSQDYVSSKLSISQNAYSKIENGHIKVNEEKLDKIAEVLEVEKEAILGFSEAMVFYNCKQSGQINTINNNLSLKKIQELYEQIINQQKEEIVNLKKQMADKI